MDSDNHQRYEYACKRIRQKKHLYLHFVLMFTGSIFLFIINKWLDVGEPTNWFVWASLAWLFIFILHFIKVFITDSFMNKNWERSQLDRMMLRQERKLHEMQSKLDRENTI